ncbi:Uncharacterised protein [[Eubacterium] contortum]|uniref:Uncharacterized protein n=2 Tax=Faecalicatena contorta TaxID=39482 RepID=A0A174J3B5_9FIRM|nr:Uncharacterised protein [[Eubacterium] contortum] [Faecalicatena contorta]
MNMKYKDFLEYLENTLEGYNLFMEKAIAFQEEKNRKRPAKNRWEPGRVQRAAYDMWKQSMQPLYDKLKSEIKSDDTQVWDDFMQNNNILETINDGITDLNFNEDI